MSGADPLSASRARSTGPGHELALGEVVNRVEYDVVGEQAGRWAQVRSGIEIIEEVRAELEAFTGVNPAITWYVIVRTTTTSETLADHLLTPPGHRERPPAPARPLTPELSAAIPTTSSAEPAPAPAVSQVNRLGFRAGFMRAAARGGLR